ncbi:hypothetical protein J5X84_31525 [Streptosporangiaceae bacterium NEAU-GS5]|nr:hypothetical protein [Streptosporangiaceae bacterium NEAU-GS5]
MSGEVFVVASVGLAAPVIVTAATLAVGAVAVGLATRTAIAGTTLALDGVAALGEHINQMVERAEVRHREACAWSTVASAVLDRNARMAVLTAACDGAQAGHLAADLRPLAPEGRSMEELLRWCGLADQQLGQIDAELAQLGARAMTEVVFADLLRTLGVRPDGPPRSATALADLLAKDAGTPRAWRDTPTLTELTESLARVLGRLSAHVTAEDRAEIRAAAQRMADAANLAEARTRLVDVRHRVQSANQAAAGARSGAVEAARLLQALQRDLPGTGQAGHETLLADLADVVAGRRRLTAGLRAEAHTVCAAVVAAADELLVRQSLLGALSELGYQVDEGFETLNSVRLVKDGWDQHAVTLALAEGGRVRSAVVRTAGAPAQSAVVSDKEVEQTWCDSFEQARERLAEQGVETAVERLVPPGTRPAPVTRARHAPPRPKTRARDHDRPE